MQRPPTDRMHPIVTQYVTCWIDRLGREETTRAWYVGRQAELATLAEVSSPGGR